MERHEVLAMMTALKLAGKRGKDGEIHHRPGRDVTMSAPKSSGRAANSRWASANRASSASFGGVCAASNAGVWRANR